MPVSKIIAPAPPVLTPPSSFLSRPVYIDVCRDGTFTMRLQNQKPFNGRAFPVFSTNNFTDAESIRTMMCFVVPNAEHPKLPKGMAWYKVNAVRYKPDGILDVEDLAGLSFGMAARYEVVRRNRYEPNQRVPL